MLYRLFFFSFNWFWFYPTFFLPFFQRVRKGSSRRTPAFFFFPPFQSKAGAYFSFLSFCQEATLDGELFFNSIYLLIPV